MKPAATAAAAVAAAKRSAPQGGFTLLEILSVLAIVAILAMFAWPHWVEQRLRAQRASAQAVLREAALHLQQVRATHDRYDPPEAATDGPHADPDAADAGGHVPLRLPLRLRVVPEGAGAGQSTHVIRLRTLEQDAFELEAVPRRLPAADRCGTLTLDHLGRQGASGTAGALACWR